MARGVRLLLYDGRHTECGMLKNMVNSACYRTQNAMPVLFPQSLLFTAQAFTPGKEIARFYPFFLSPL